MTLWQPVGGEPQRLVFTGVGDGATFYGNVLFAEYNRAVVDVVAGGQRVRYLLKNITGEPPQDGCCDDGRCSTPRGDYKSGGSAIATAEGNLNETYTVATLDSAQGATINFALTYNSYNADSSHAQMDTVAGYGWTHSYNTLLFHQGPDMYRMDSGGRTTKYSALGSGTFTASPGYFETLEENSSGSFTITQKDQTQFHFSYIPDSPFTVQGPVYRLTGIVDRNGNTTQLAYADGNLVTITDTYGRSLNLEYNEQNKLERIIDPLQRETTLDYDPSASKLERITDPLLNSIQYTYNSALQMTQKEDQDGRSFGYIYENGKPVAIEDGNGDRLFTLSNSHNWATDSHAELTAQLRQYVPATTTMIDGRGNTWQDTYNEHGYLVETTAPTSCGCGVTQYEYDPVTLQVSKETDANNHSTSYDYDQLGNLIKVTNALGHESFYTYEPVFSRLESMTDRMGYTTKWQYDSHGNRTYEIDPLGHTLVWTYYDDGNLRTEQDKNGNVTEYGYDVHGNLTKTVDALKQVTTMTYDAVGNLASRTDANGDTWTFTYDGLDRMTEEADPWQYETRYEYDGVGNLVTLIDANGHVTDYKYDLRSRLEKTIDARGYETLYEYDGNNNLRSVTDANLHTREYFYDPANRLEKTTDADQHATKYGYDPVGRQIWVRAADGGLSKTDYDAIGRVQWISDPLERQTRFEYDRNDNLVRMIDAEKVVTEHHYDKLNRLKHTVEDVGGIEAKTSYRYDAGGRLIESSDPLDHVTEYRYDEVDQLRAVISPLGNRTSYQYDKVGRQSKVTDGARRSITTTYTPQGWVETMFDGVTTTSYQYDRVGNRTEVEVSDRAPIAYFYDDTDNLVRTEQETSDEKVITKREVDPVGNVIVSTDGEGYETIYTYYDTDWLKTVTNPENETTEYIYDPVGRRTLVRFANGSVRGYKYDWAGQLVATWGGPKGHTEYQYDKLGRQTCAIDANFRQRETVYDELSRLKRVENEMDQPIDYTYDKAGRRLTLTDANGNTTEYAYDDDNRVLWMQYPLGEKEHYSYDAGDLLVRKHTPNGDDIDYTYNAAGALASVAFGGNLVTYSRDAAGAVTEIAGPVTTMVYTYDPLGRMTTATDNALSQTLVYDYDKRGLRTQMTGAGHRVTYEYDGAQRLTEVALDDDAPSVYEYDAGGRRTRFSRPNGVVTEYSYDMNDRLTDLVTSNDRAVLASFHYHFDSVGNRIGLDLSNGNRIRYEFDVAYRLTRETRIDISNNVIFDQAFSYDDIGNRLASVKNGVTIAYTYNSNNQLIAETTDGVAKRYLYDSNGNNVRIVASGGSEIRMKYDPLNRLTHWREYGTRGVKVEQQVYRGAEWHRAAVTGSGVATAFVYDGDNVVADIGRDGEVGTYYVTPVLDQNVSMTRGKDTWYYSHDGLGSVRTLTDTSGNLQNFYAFNAWGESYTSQTTENVEQEYKWTGRRLNAVSGLQYNRYRMYSSSTGRWGARDPVYHRGGINLYVYAHGEPTSWHDPFGLAGEQTSDKKPKESKTAEELCEKCCHLHLLLVYDPDPGLTDQGQPIEGVQSNKDIKTGRNADFNKCEHKPKYKDKLDDIGKGWVLLKSKKEKYIKKCKKDTKDPNAGLLITAYGHGSEEGGIQFPAKDAQYVRKTVGLEGGKGADRGRYPGIDIPDRLIGKYGAFIHSKGSAKQALRGISGIQLKSCHSASNASKVSESLKIPATGYEGELKNNEPGIPVTSNPMTGKDPQKNR